MPVPVLTSFPLCAWSDPPVSKQDVEALLHKFALKIELTKEEEVALVMQFKRTDGPSFLKLTETQVKESVMDDAKLDREVARLLYQKIQDQQAKFLSTT